MKKIRKAVIPAAGFGTRFLPFTKAVPKELIPLVDKPVIQYVIEEAVASGIEQILIIVSSGKNAIQDHFNPARELEERLAANGKTQILQELRQIDRLAEISYIYQTELNGLGDAVRYGKHFVGDEPFAVLLGDTVLHSESMPVTAQLIDSFNQVNSPVVALEEVAMARVSKYGVIDGVSNDNITYQIKRMVEKPSMEEAPSNLVFASRYLFTPDIFEELAKTPRGKGNEIQLTDAMQQLLARRPMYGRRINGKRYDVGDKLSFLKSTVEFGLRRPEYRDEFVAFLKSLEL